MRVGQCRRNPSRITILTGGEIVVSAAKIGDKNYKFTGKESDSQSGLDNFGARYDSSALGRFMTPDWAASPITVPYAKFGDPQTLNLYAYVENSPVNQADADGHAPPGYSFGPDCNGESQGDCPNHNKQLEWNEAHDATAQAAAAAQRPQERAQNSGSTLLADNYNVDKFSHGSPHIDRVDKNE